jgi:hypothetical protein
LVGKQAFEGFEGFCCYRRMPATPVPIWSAEHRSALMVMAT